MALGKAALAATTYTTIYIVPAGEESTANIRVVNRDLVNSITLRLAICPAGYVQGEAPTDADYIEPPDLVIPAGAVLEETGLEMSAGESVVAYSSAATVTVRVHGFKEAA